ncbi:MAG: dipeptidyl aminopeptidase/acylaminoacyl-peptidase-like protein [Phycisphaerales bacterium]|nr:dipeptidyl aminopeptidase/acylaminoacyl-peptidase-like protein [Phycisphaerales bacterium]
MKHTMHTLAIIALAATVVLGSQAFADSTTPVAGKLNNGWDGKLLNYERTEKLIVEETTPTDAQVNFWMRPPQATADAAEPRDAGAAKSRAVGKVNVTHLRFKDATGDIVPALLCTPKDQPGPFPLVIAVHGLMSNKAQVCGQVAPALAKRGYAVLAADMPCHGERPGNPFDLVDARNFKKSFPLYRKAVIDVHQLMDLAEQRADIDHKAGFVLAGYSMGSWISSVAGPSDDRVRAMVLMVGGAFDIPAESLKIPEIATLDPRLALAHFTGRPLLLLNGKTDNVVAPDLSKRLFAASADPKKQIWYDSGHFLPDQAYEDAAKWIAEGAAKAEALKADAKPRAKAG